MGDFVAIPPGDRMTLSADHTAEPPVDNFAFVMNVSGLAQESSYTLAPGHQLRRASAHEIRVVENTMSRMATQTQLMLNPWKQRRTASGQWEPVPEGDRRYFVIAFQGNNQIIEELAAVFSLAPLELKIGFTIVHVPNTDRTGSGVILNTLRLFHLLEDASWGRLEFVEVTASDVAEFTTIHAQIQRHNHTLVDVNRYTRELQGLQNLPPASPLLFRPAGVVACPSARSQGPARLNYAPDQKQGRAPQQSVPEAPRLQQVRSDKPRNCLDENVRLSQPPSPR